MRTKVLSLFISFILDVGDSHRRSFKVALVRNKEMRRTEERRVRATLEWSQGVSTASFDNFINMTALTGKKN